MSSVFEYLPCVVDGLRLRLLRLDDLAAFHTYRSDPAVARYQGWSPMTRDEAASFLESQAGWVSQTADSWQQLALAEQTSDRLIGDVGLYLSADKAQAEFGLSIASAEQGQGYGLACIRVLIDLLFSKTSVKEVVASTDARNIACRTILQRAGMTPAGTHEAEYKNEICVEHLFSIRRPA